MQGKFNDGTTKYGRLLFQSELMLITVDSQTARFFHTDLQQPHLQPVDLYIP